MWVLSLGRWKRRWPPKDDEMIQHEERKHQGTTTLTFTTSLGTPLEGLRYRLSDGQGAVREGATGKGGRGPLIKKSMRNEGLRLADTWNLSSNADVQVEVQRDDGSWKVIGCFQHNAYLEKHIRVVVGAIAMPFQMAPV